MDVVHFDLNKYLQRNIFPSRTVLVFPPFNGFRRFLIHKLIEDNFASQEVTAFSIGQDIGRRIVVCYKGLVRDSQNKVLGPQVLPTKLKMIEKEKCKQPKSSPAGAVYRPPAARLSESKKSPESKPSESKRVKRPDQQMYVPRPKRASYESDQSRSRSQSSSRTSFDSDTNSKISSPILKDDVTRLSNSHERNIVKSKKTSRKSCSDLKSTSDESKMPTVHRGDSTLSKFKENVNAEIKADHTESSCESDEPCRPTRTAITDSITTTTCDADVSVPVENHNSESSQRHSRALGHCERLENQTENSIVMEVEGLKSSFDNDEDSVKTSLNKDEQNVNVKEPTNTCSVDSPIRSFSIHTNSTGNELMSKENIMDDLPASVNNEAIETISISSDSKSEQSNMSVTQSSESDSESKDSVSGSDEVHSGINRIKDDQMEVENTSHLTTKLKCSGQTNLGENNLKTKSTFPSLLPVTDVFIISDSSSSDENKQSTKTYDITKCKNTKNVKQKNTILSETIIKDEKCTKIKRKSSIDPNECDWESLYDESGECLVPSLMEELTSSVGRVRITSAESDYREFQTIEERTNDGECVIEIYGFPAEFKTTDLFNIFASYRNKNLQIKWVDDTHALGVFPSPLLADEVLASKLPFVKTRPLRLGIAESRTKARNLVLPPLPSTERPKTCVALARRLVSGALGMRLPMSSQDREKEKQVLKEAREKRRQEAKQREAAWEGTITS